MLNFNDSLLLVIDVQEKLVSMLNENTQSIFEKISKIIQAAKILNVETIVTEQYPKGLGQTIEPVRNILKEKYFPFEKTTFSAIKEKSIFGAIQKTEKKQIVIFGIEAHICVFQTALDLKENGYEVFVVQDICFSRNNSEKELALQNLRHTGISTLTIEMVLFLWLEGSKTPGFKEIQSLIK